MKLKNRDIILISGPCSAESEEQLLQTAEQLIQYCKPDIFRAGIWKARTNINTFEGFGEKSLKWLLEVKKKFGLPVATEVLTPSHVEICLKAEIDYLWFGARSVVNPYLIGELSEALKGTSVTVMVKNPVNPEIKLWAGAIERLMSKGVNKIIAIHRGFSTYFNEPYRNMPLWEIPLELRRLFPDIPMICDPSHICGKTNCITDIMQQALDLEMDGLMIETHVHPENALSDKSQQMTPFQLGKKLSELIVRQYSSPEMKMLNHLRNEIDVIDGQLLETLARRMNIVSEIGKLKKKYKITILQSERSRFIFHDRLKKGKMLNLNADFLTEILKTIQSEAIRIQIEIMNDDNDKNSDEQRTI